jgi:hypothetical protein
MAQVKLLKIASDGVSLEFDSSSDDITLNSYTVQGGGPVLSGTGLDLNNQDVVDVNDLAFNNPTSGTINQTAGNLIIDDIMGKERANVMTTASSVLFPAISDSAGEVDAFRVPSLAGAPSATPTVSGSGYLVFDTTGDNLYAWDGAAWKNLGVASAANNLDNSYTAEEALSARDVVYISSADSVSKAKADAAGTSQAIGFATAAVLITDPANIRSEGIVTGFSGLTAGARYYLSAATAGAITATIPAGSGNTIQSVGFAKSATAMHVQFQSLGRRA